MSTLRARHLPQQIPEASPQPKSPEPQDEPDRQQERIASDNIQSQPQDPMSSMLPQLLQAMPNGEAMSKTLQQVSQMQSLISQMQTGNGGGMAGLLSMLMSQAGEMCIRDSICAPWPTKPSPSYMWVRPVLRIT